ncbi:MAG: ureidoglycolate lyase [Verrucomicrobia bacterium]|nr:ureidoglycolate lyase [Verrucomicrobiota bacterium]
MSAVTISIEPLTSEAFAPYGDVVEAEGHEGSPINQGRANRFDALVTVDCEGTEKPPVISMVEARQYDLPKTVTFLERHPFGSQAFFPNSSTPFLVVVAAPSESVDETTLKAFVSNGKQGVNYHRNTWHHVMLTPFGDVTFIVVDRSDPESNCIEHWYAEEDQPLIDSSGLKL